MPNPPIPTNPTPLAPWDDVPGMLCTDSAEDCVMHFYGGLFVGLACGAISFVVYLLLRT